jgi:hypothetical protein
MQLKTIIIKPGIQLARGAVHLVGIMQKDYILTQFDTAGS